MTTPDWIAVGANVAEGDGSGFVFTTVKRITDTLIVLGNGSRYRVNDLRKVGDSGRTHLYEGTVAVGWRTKGVVRDAADAASRASFQVTERGADPTEALDKMQAAIDAARQQLAELTEGATP